ncbi:MULTISPECIES: M48 family metallopeptidase [Nostoc]|uniref:M48 family metalloprotease n=2 Tax=Nostoc TaxID=1177 RepID=A0ABR8I7V1_9NOSO|nr:MULTISPECIES: M48 family metallopeptidase [Nostoc]MBD2561421.1 M48 family metalloprotease [Nostoc linckia FACHB-391]MBD2646560.1 M48 family metalloprotease [Nostoc foliaceum FACHB-393]
MLNWDRTLLTTSSLCLLLFSAMLPVQAKPVQQKKPAPTATTFYQQAKKELPEDFYTLYRVIDRIARANELDNRPWRVVAVPKYDVNAFASDVNLVAIYDGILDQLAGDSSALACVVAHEMGHHTKRHIAVGAAQRTELIAKIQEEATKEVLGERETANQESTAATVGGAVLGGVIGGNVGGFLGSVLGNQGTQRQVESQQRINEIVEKKKKELEQRLAEQERQQEFEADEIGYIASVKAGFEPEGCLRVMQVLAQTPGSEFDTTHPAVPKRIEAIKALIIKYPPQTLVKEGEARISKTKPLTYNISKDKTSLRINSVRGGSQADDIERRFGK